MTFDRRFNELREKFDKLNQAKLVRYQSLKYYSHKMGLKHKPVTWQAKWIEERTQGNWSVDNTCSPHNISFELKSDLLMIKLSYPNTDLFCDTHQV